MKRILSLIFLVGVATLALCACDSSNSESSMVHPNEAESTVMEQFISVSNDEGDVVLPIPKDWEDIAIIHTNAEETQIEDKIEGKRFLFGIYEKVANTANNAMGNVWVLYEYTEDAFKEQFGEMDPGEIIGAQGYLLGTREDHVYVLNEPTDVQLLEDDDKSIEQFVKLQSESQLVIEKFLLDNNIKANMDCPIGSCYKVSLDE